MPTRRAIAAACALFAVLAAVAVAARGGGDDPAEARPARADPGRLDDAAALRQARALLIRDCMRQRGFADYPTPDDTAESAEPEAPYGYFDVRWARAHGYGSDLRAQDDVLARADPVRSYFERLAPARSAAALRAVNGASPDGLRATLPGGGVVRRSARSCTSDAEDRLYGDVRAWYRVSKIGDNLSGVWGGLVVGDRRFRRAVSRWSRCMRRSGHPARNPPAARASALAAGDRRIEIATAVAEATCAQRTGLAATARALDRSYRRAVRARWRPVLAARARMVRAAIPRARAVIARG